MIFKDRDEAKRVSTGKVTAVLRRASEQPFASFTQQVQWRRAATNEDLPILRERQADKPDRPAALGTLGTVEITDQRRWRLGDLTVEHAQMLGHGSIRNLKSWCRQHLGGWDPDNKAWLVQLRVVRVVEDMSVFLGRPGPSGDYTTDRDKAIDDLEAVDGPTLMRQVDQSRRNQRVRARKSFDEWELSEELARVESEASALGLDIGDHREVIADRIARARRMIDQRKAA